GLGRAGEPSPSCARLAGPIAKVRNAATQTTVPPRMVHLSRGGERSGGPTSPPGGSVLGAALAALDRGPASRLAAHRLELERPVAALEQLAGVRDREVTLAAHAGLERARHGHPQELRMLGAA